MLYTCLNVVAFHKKKKNICIYIPKRLFFYEQTSVTPNRIEWNGGATIEPTVVYQKYIYMYTTYFILYL